MLDRKKARLWVVSTLLVVLLLGCGFGAGYLTREYMTPKAAEPSASADANALTVGQASVETVAITAKVERVVRFLYCGHDATRIDDARVFAGMDMEDVQNTCDDWTLTYFSRERLVLTNEYSGFCPDHLVLRADDKGLGVYRTDPKTFEEVEVSHFTNSVEQVPAETRQMLEEGMPFENLAEIESFLEDLES